MGPKYSQGYLNGEEGSRSHNQRDGPTRKTELVWSSPAVKMEGPGAKDASTPKSWEKQEQVLPWSLQKDLDFSPMRPISDFCSPERSENNFVLF